MTQDTRYAKPITRLRRSRQRCNINPASVIISSPRPYPARFLSGVIRHSTRRTVFMRN